MTDIELEISGNVSLSERLRDSSPYEILDLINRDFNDIEIDIGHCDDDSKRERLGFFIRIAAFHKTNPTTGRTFHAHLEVNPNAGQLQMIRDYINFLLKIPPETLDEGGEESAA